MAFGFELLLCLALDYELCGNYDGLFILIWTFRMTTVYPALLNNHSIKSHRFLMLILPFLTKQFELNMKCSYRNTIILLKKNVEDHMKGKEDQQICMEESD